MNTTLKNRDCRSLGQVPKLEETYANIQVTAAYEAQVRRTCQLPPNTDLCIDMQFEAGVTRPYLVLHWPKGDVVTAALAEIFSPPWQWDHLSKVILGLTPSVRGNNPTSAIG